MNQYDHQPQLINMNVDFNIFAYSSKKVETDGGRSETLEGNLNSQSLRILTLHYY